METLDTVLIETSGCHQPAQNLLLSEQVRLALQEYFDRLGNNDVSGLYALVLAEIERPLILTVLEHCGYNQSKAAQVLGLSRSTLRKKIGQYGLE
ncbi:Fis family transcriptional regulator [Methylococcus sp. EFPC2]|nr:Fis family transcriptional regulator [Methylococcus sp. EFPC2]